MRRGFKCKNEVLQLLESKYDDIAKQEYEDGYLDALKNFDSFAETNLRKILGDFYRESRSADQAWKSCKGSLNEYAIAKA